MKISITTATYDSLQHHPEVFESIRQQAYPNLEHTVINGG